MKNCKHIMGYSLWVILCGMAQSLYADTHSYSCSSVVTEMTPPSVSACISPQDAILSNASTTAVEEDLSQLIIVNKEVERRKFFEHLKRQALVDQFKNYYRSRDRNIEIKDDRRWSLNLLPQDLKQCVELFKNRPEDPTDDSYQDVSAELSSFIDQRNGKYLNPSNSDFNVKKINELQEYRDSLIKASEAIMKLEREFSISDAILNNIKAKVPPDLLLSQTWEPPDEYLPQGMRKETLTESEQEAMTPTQTYLYHRWKMDLITFKLYHLKNRFHILLTPFDERHLVEETPPRPGYSGIPLYQNIFYHLKDHRESPDAKINGLRPMAWIEQNIQKAARQMGENAMLTARGDSSKKITGLCHMDYSKENLEKLAMTDGLREKVLDAHHDERQFKEIACEIIRAKHPEHGWGGVALYMSGMGLACSLGWYVSGPVACATFSGVYFKGTALPIAAYMTYSSMSRALELSQDMPYIHHYFLSSTDEGEGIAGAQSFINTPKELNNAIFWSWMNGIPVSAGGIALLTRMTGYSVRAASEAMQVASNMARASRVGEGPTQIAMSLFSQGEDAKALSGFLKFIDQMDEGLRREFQETIGSLTKKSLDETLDPMIREKARQRALRMLQKYDENPHLSLKEIDRMQADELAISESDFTSPNLALRNAGGVRMGGATLPEDVAARNVGYVEYTGPQRGMQGTWNVEMVSPSRIKVFRNNGGIRQEFFMSREAFKNNFTRAATTTPTESFGPTLQEAPTGASQVPKRILHSYTPKPRLYERIKSGEVDQVEYLGRQESAQGIWHVESLDGSGFRFRLTRSEGGQTRRLLIGREELARFKAKETEIVENFSETPQLDEAIENVNPIPRFTSVRGRHGAYNYFSTDEYARQANPGDRVIIQTDDGISHRVRFMHSSRENIEVQDLQGNVTAIDRNRIQSIRKSVYPPQGVSWRTSPKEVILTNLDKFNGGGFQSELRANIASKDVLHPSEPIPVKIYVIENTGEVLDYSFSANHQPQDVIVHAPNVRELTIHINSDAQFSLPPEFEKDLTPSALSNLRTSLNSAKYWQPSSY